MGKDKNLIRAIISFFIGSMFYACGTSHNIQEEMIYKEDGFTYAKFKGNELAIAGISSEEITLIDLERIEYSNLFTSVLIREQMGVNNFKVVNSQQLINELENENYFNIMKEADVERKLLNNAIQFIKESMPSLDYILLAYIENENIIDRSEEALVTDEKGEEEYETEYTKNYFITVEFQVYDLLSEKLIWNNRLYNEAERSETRTTETGFFESCFSGALNNLIWGEPAEIDRKEMLTKIFEKYAELLSTQ